MAMSKQEIQDAVNGMIEDSREVYLPPLPEGMFGDEFDDAEEL